MVTKICTVCKEDLPLERYYNYSRSKDGKAYRCKGCEQKAVSDYRKKYRELTKELQRYRNRKSKYGLGKEQYDKMVEDQQGKCKICGENLDLSNKPNMKTRAVVDHCHSSNKIRGLLCARCNQALGLFRDSPTIIRNAIDYLIKHKSD